MKWELWWLTTDSNSNLSQTPSISSITFTLHPIFFPCTFTIISLHKSPLVSMNSLSPFLSSHFSLTFFLCISLCSYSPFFLLSVFSYSLLYFSLYALLFPLSPFLSHSMRGIPRSQKKFTAKSWKNLLSFFLPSNFLFELQGQYF